MSDEDMKALEGLMRQAVKLLPKLRAPLSECDEKWAEMVEVCILDDLLGTNRLRRLKGHFAADALAYGPEVQEAKRLTITKLRRA